MLLEIMPNTRNIRSDFDPISEPDPRNLTQRRIGLLRSCRVDTDADSPLLRTPP